MRAGRAALRLPVVWKELATLGEVFDFMAMCRLHDTVVASMRDFRRPST